MARLPDAQRRALERMAAGDEVWTLSGRHAHAFWLGRLSDRAPSLATLHAMWKRGYIADYQNAPGGNKYRITDAGRAVVSALPGEPLVEPNEA